MTPVVRVDISQILKLQGINSEAAVNAFVTVLYTRLKALAEPVALSLLPRRSGRLRRAHFVRRESAGVVSMGFDLTIAPYAPAVRYRRRSSHGGKLVIDVLETDGKLRVAVNRAIDESMAALASLLVRVGGTP